MKRSTTARARGSTLLLAIILLGVLSVIGVAAVALSSQERTNASVKMSRDRMVACAAAAQAQLWAELLRYGAPRFLGRNGYQVPAFTLPDGSKLLAGHYRDPDVTVVDTSVRPSECKPLDTEEYIDLTNKDSFFTMSGSCFQITARCKDAQGREMEIEFGLNTLL